MGSRVMSMPSSAHCVGMSVDCSCMCECASARAYALTCLHSLTPAHKPVGASFDTNDRQPCFALYGRGIHKNKRCSSRNAQNSAGARCNVWSASLGANPTHILLRTTVHSTPCILQLWQALQRPCPAALTQRVHIRRIGCIVASAQHPPTARVPQPPRVDLTYMGCPALPDTEVRVARTGGPSPYMPALRVPCTHTTLAHVSGVAKQLCLPHTLPDKQAKRPANAHLHKCTVSSNPACVLEAEARTTKTPEGRAAGLHLTPSAHLARDVGEVVQDLLAGLVANVQPHMGVAAQHELRVDAA